MCSSFFFFFDFIFIKLYLQESNVVAVVNLKMFKGTGRVPIYL